MATPTLSLHADPLSRLPRPPASLVIIVTGLVLALTAPPGSAGATEKPAPLTLSGRVFDAATAAPIPRFRIILGVESTDGVMWQGHRITHHEGGRFDLGPDERAWEQTRLRVEAEGYRPAVSRIVEKSEGVVVLEFALMADPGLEAVVHTPDGAPAAGAQAAWSTLSHAAAGSGATITLSSDERLDARVVTADSQGGLRLPPESDAGTIIIAHPSGYAEVKPADLATAPVVVLRKWCRVEGQVLAGAKPVPGQTVRIYHCGSQNGDSTTLTWADEAITGAGGRFTCDRVIQGRLVIDRVFNGGGVEGSVNGLATTIEVRERETTHVKLGGPGRTVLGRFEAPKDLDVPIDWSKVHARLALNAPHVGFPQDNETWKTYGAFLQTDEGKAYYRDFLPVGPDGSFRVEGVPTGVYQLFLWVTGPAVGKPAGTDTHYATGYGRIEVEPPSHGRNGEPIDLGTIVLWKRSQDK
jgi:hypothetical protein